MNIAIRELELVKIKWHTIKWDVRIFIDDNLTDPNMKITAMKMYTMWDLKGM